MPKKTHKLSKKTRKSAKPFNKKNAAKLLERKVYKKVIDSYTIRGTKIVIQAGDSVFMRSPNSRKPSYVALVEKIELHVETNEVKVRVLWYYRPNDLYHGRKYFYGERELLLSDRDDVQSVETIEGKCIVHTLEDFMKLKCIREDDYYCRFEYKVHSAVYAPERADVYCLCNKAYNPDVMMVECEKCNDWFHSECIGMTDEEVKKMEHYFCSACISRDEEVNGDEVNDVEVNDVEVAVPKRRRTG